MSKTDSEEPASMQEILQTIRGVIAGENTEQPKPPAAQDDVLELTEVIQEDGSVVSLTSPTEAEESNVSPADVLGNIDAALGTNPPAAAVSPTPTVDPASVMETAPLPAEEIVAAAPLPKSNRRAILSDRTVAASSQALKKLVKTVGKPHHSGIAFRSGTTIEDLVIEALKPQLSEWLDKNLPQMVKHLVEKEIQKLIPKDEE